MEFRRTDTKWLGKNIGNGAAMKLKRQLGRIFFNALPSYNHILYKISVRYADRYNGDNNSNPETNGEYFFLRNVLPKLGDGVIFDIGANVGSWAAYALNINPKATIHCFEPSKTNYSMLALKEWPKNVYLNNFGLGEVSGVLELNVYSVESGENSLYWRRCVYTGEAIKKEQISIKTIDDYCKEKGISQIDLIKVDVEGHELAVLKGARGMLGEKKIRVIQFEYGGCNLDARVHLADIWDFLESYGFRFNKLYPEGPRHIDQYQRHLETFKYSNWVAIHANHEFLLKITE